MLKQWHLDIWIIFFSNVHTSFQPIIKPDLLTVFVCSCRKHFFSSYEKRANIS